MPAGITFTETMRGQMADGTPFEFTVTVASDNLDDMLSNPDHQARIDGTMTSPALSPSPLKVANGVGRGTQIDHIQGNMGGDDCLEWFGGTVNVKYFVSSACADDGFDWQLGTTGARQYGLQVQYGPNLQTGAQSRPQAMMLPRTQTGSLRCST